MDVPNKFKLNLAFEILKGFPDLTVDQIRFKIGKEFLVLKYDQSTGMFAITYQGYTKYGYSPIEACQKLRIVPSIKEQIDEIFYDLEDNEIPKPPDMPLNFLNTSSHQYKLR